MISIAKFFRALSLAFPSNLSELLTPLQPAVTSIANVEASLGRNLVIAHLDNIHSLPVLGLEPSRASVIGVLDPIPLSATQISFNASLIFILPDSVISLLTM